MICFCPCFARQGRQRTAPSAGFGADRARLPDVDSTADGAIGETTAAEALFTGADYQHGGSQERGSSDLSSDRRSPRRHVTVQGVAHSSDPADTQDGHGPMVATVVSEPRAATESAATMGMGSGRHRSGGTWAEQHGDRQSGPGRPAGQRDGGRDAPPLRATFAPDVPDNDPTRGRYPRALRHVTVQSSATLPAVSSAITLVSSGGTLSAVPSVAWMPQWTDSHRDPDGYYTGLQEATHSAGTASSAVHVDPVASHDDSLGRMTVTGGHHTGGHAASGNSFRVMRSVSIGIGEPGQPMGNSHNRLYATTGGSNRSVGGSNRSVPVVPSPDRLAPGQANMTGTGTAASVDDAGAYGVAAVAGDRVVTEAHGVMTDA